MIRFYYKYDRIIYHVLNLLLFSGIIYFKSNMELLTQFPLQFIVLGINFIVIEWALKIVNSSTNKK